MAFLSELLQPVKGLEHGEKLRSPVPIGNA
jgi:hypothetical protein